MTLIRFDCTLKALKKKKTNTNLILNSTCSIYRTPPTTHEYKINKWKFTPNQNGDPQSCLVNHISKAACANDLGPSWANRVYVWLFVWIVFLQFFAVGFVASASLSWLFEIVNTSPDDIRLVPRTLNPLAWGLRSFWATAFVWFLMYKRPETLHLKFSQ